MTRQYFCWKVSLTYRCGCTEQAPIAHRCPPDREGCNSWLTHKRTDKNCEAHRAGWGLALPQSDASSSSASSSPSPSPGPSEPSPFRQGAGDGDGDGGRAGEGVVRRRGSPVGAEGGGGGGGEAGAAVAGRKVVGYY